MGGHTRSGDDRGTRQCSWVTVAVVAGLLAYAPAVLADNEERLQEVEDKLRVMTEELKSLKAREAIVPAESKGLEAAQPSKEKGGAAEQQSNQQGLKVRFTEGIVL